MSAIREHFRRHGAIHLLWVIAVLTMVLAALLTRSPGAESLISLISFASAIAALLLAVVAIFYAIVSNQSFSDASSDLTRSASDVLAASHALDRNMQEYLAQSQTLLLAVEAVPTSVESLRDQFAEALENSAKADATPAADRGNRIFGSVNNGVATTLHIIYLSYKKGKEFRAGDVMERDYFEGLVSGICSVMSYCDIDGIKMIRAGATYQVKSLGRYSEGDFESSYENLPVELRKYLKKARLFFGEEKSEAETSELGGAGDE